MPDSTEAAAAIVTLNTSDGTRHTAFLNAVPTGPAQLLLDILTPMGTGYSIQKQIIRDYIDGSGLSQAQALANLDAVHSWRTERLAKIVAAHAVPLSARMTLQAALNTHSNEVRAIINGATEPPPPPSPPVATMSAPASGGTYAGPITLTATVTGDVTSVEFLRGGTTVIGTDSSPTGGWSIVWDPTTGSIAPNGTYSITARATGPGGVGAQSAARTVTLNNASDPPPGEPLISSLLASSLSGYTQLWNERFQEGAFTDVGTPNQPNPLEPGQTLKTEYTTASGRLAIMGPGHGDGQACFQGNAGESAFYHPDLYSWHPWGLRCSMKRDYFGANGSNRLSASGTPGWVTAGFHSRWAPDPAKRYVPKFLFAAWRIRLNSILTGVWPGMAWLLPVDANGYRGASFCELDIQEWFGGTPAGQIRQTAHHRLDVSSEIPGAIGVFDAAGGRSGTTQPMYNVQQRFLFQNASHVVPPGKTANDWVVHSCEIEPWGTTAERDAGHFRLTMRQDNQINVQYDSVTLANMRRWNPATGRFDGDPGGYPIHGNFKKFTGWTVRSTVQAEGPHGAIPSNLAGSTFTWDLSEVAIFTKGTAALPSAAITSPPTGQTKYGKTSIAAEITNGATATSVKFYRSGSTTPIGTASAATAFGWVIEWDTATVVAGTYQITARATGPAGTGPMSAAIAVTVVSSPPPPPAAYVAVPRSGATVSGDVTLSAGISNGAATTSVEFFRNGVSLGQGVAGPYGWAFSWQSTPFDNGSRTITAQATGPDGVGPLSAPVTVTVNNTTAAIYIPTPLGWRLYMRETFDGVLAGSGSTRQLSSGRFRAFGPGFNESFGQGSTGSPNQSTFNSYDMISFPTPGVMRLSMRPDPTVPRRTALNGRPGWIAACLDTKSVTDPAKRFMPKFCRIEGSIRQNNPGAGVWPAFWLTADHGGVPKPSGFNAGKNGASLCEPDIMEQFYLAATTDAANKVTMAMHMPVDRLVNTQATGALPNPVKTQPGSLCINVGSRILGRPQTFLASPLAGTWRRFAIEITDDGHPHIRWTWLLEGAGTVSFSTRELEAQGYVFTDSLSYVKQWNIYINLQAESALNISVGYVPAGVVGPMSIDVREIAVFVPA